MLHLRGPAGRVARPSGWSTAAAAHLHRVTVLSPHLSEARFVDLTPAGTIYRNVFSRFPCDVGLARSPWNDLHHVFFGRTFLRKIRRLRFVVTGTESEGSPSKERISTR